jgi:predicted metal-dependent hydrolase
MNTTILICKLPVNYRSDASLRAKIIEVDVIIDELFNTALKSVASGNHAEYELDTGQTKTRVKYTSMSSVQKAIEDYENLRQMYVNKLNRSTGHVRLMNEDNFKRRIR